MFHSWSFCGHVHWSRQTSTTVSCQEDFIAYCKTNRFYSSGVNRALYLCVMATQCLQRKIAMHIGCRCRGAGSRCRRGSLCEGTAASGRSHSGHATVAPPQSTTEPSNPAQGASVKQYIRKRAKNSGQAVRSVARSVRNSPVTTMVREGGEERLPHSLWRVHASSPDRSCGLWRTHTGVGEKSVRRKRETVTTPYPPTLPVLPGEAGLGRGAEGLKLSLGKWGGELLV